MPRSPKQQKDYDRAIAKASKLAARKKGVSPSELRDALGLSPQQARRVAIEIGAKKGDRGGPATRYYL